MITLTDRHHDELLVVALNTPVGDFFDYLCPLTTPLPAIGVRVSVSFARRVLTGFVVARKPICQSDVPPHKLRAISAVLDEMPLLDAQILALANWLHRYYHHPLGEVLAVMLPTLINQGKPLQHSVWTLCHHSTDGLSKSAKKQRALIDYLHEHGTISDDELARLSFSKTTINALLDKGFIRSVQVPTQKPPPATLATPPLPANDAQQSAITAITDALNQQHYQGFLLNGITGSGKTEVYLQAMQHALAAGKQVLILIPEIGLTPQTRARFADRFVAKIITLHSNMTDAERLAGWQACQDGSAQIVIGTRSSILYPFADLGLIIIDEAHDTSYKQQDHLRYHACDVAMWRAYQLGIPIVLGSATPSLEQYKMVDDGKLTELRLTMRAGSAKAATLRLVDTRLGMQQSTMSNGQHIHTRFAPETIAAMRAQLNLGKQVLVFLNRRGYAPVLLCHACGWQANCPNCDAHLTLHKGFSPILKCHHCHYQTIAPHACPECNSTNLDTLGAGTAKLFDELHSIFANPQTTRHTYPIIQIDRDTMRKKGAWEAALAQIHSGMPAILVGTQMIAKGHHFADVTLVVIVDADLGFLSPDFRSPEHTAQRIIQVAGRAGRADSAGEVYIQTLQPQNPMLQRLVRHGYDTFARELLHERKLLGLPPYSFAALIRADGAHYKDAKNAIAAAKRLLPTPHPFAINAPIDAPMAKKNNRHFVQMLILSKSRHQLHQFLDGFWAQIKQLPEAKKVRLSIDIDPVGW